MALVARTFCVLLLLLGFYLIGRVVFSVDAEVVYRLVLGFLMAAAGYQLWARVDRVEAHKKAARAE